MPGSSLAGPAPTHPPPGQSGTSVSLVTFKLPLAESPHRAGRGRGRAAAEEEEEGADDEAPRGGAEPGLEAHAERARHLRGRRLAEPPRGVLRGARARARAGGPTSKHSVHPAISKSGPRAPPTHLGMRFESFVRGWLLATSEVALARGRADSWAQPEAHRPRRGAGRTPPRRVGLPRLQPDSYRPARTRPSTARRTSGHAFDRGFLQSAFGSSSRWSQLFRPDHP